MLTLNSKKMSKSTGNNILPEEIFSGNNKIFNKSFHPEVVKFFMMQAHYRSILDLSEKALKASEKGYNKLITAYNFLNEIKPSNNESSFKFDEWNKKCYSAMNNDFNSPLLIANLFDAVKYINSVKNGLNSISKKTLNKVKVSFKIFVDDILGIYGKNTTDTNINKVDEILNILLKLRKLSRENKDFKTSDEIRNSLKKIGITLEDNSNDTDYKIN